MSGRNGLKLKQPRFKKLKPSTKCPPPHPYIFKALCARRDRPMIGHQQQHRTWRLASLDLRLSWAPAMASPRAPRLASISPASLRTSGWGSMPRQASSRPASSCRLASMSCPRVWGVNRKKKRKKQMETRVRGREGHAHAHMHAAHRRAQCATVVCVCDAG